MRLQPAPYYDARYAPHRALATPAAVPADLAASALGVANRSALERLLAERRADVARDFWVAVVPGASEEWGHHRAPPARVERAGVQISREYAARIARGYQLLEAGVVRFVLLSGGSVDAARPDYNEALRGREVMLARYGSAWAPRGALADRILVDPVACHSTTNLRNAAKLCVALGLDRVLIATTMPPNPRVWPTRVPLRYFVSQGWYFLHHGVSTFDWRCRRSLGYALGAFEWFEAPALDGARVTAIAHHGFNVARLAGDAFGP